MEAFSFKDFSFVELVRMEEGSITRLARSFTVLDM